MSHCHTALLPAVLQSFVHGNSLRSQLLAVVVPDPEYLLPWAKERGLGQDLKQVGTQ